MLHLPLVRLRAVAPAGNRRPILPEQPRPERQRDIRQRQAGNVGERVGFLVKRSAHLAGVERAFTSFVDDDAAKVLVSVFHPIIDALRAQR